MEKNKECQIVEDLLIGYKDKTLNPESKKLVEDHLTNCTSCKEMLKDIEKEDIKNKIEEEKNIEPLKKIKNKMSNKNKIVAIISIALVIGLVFNALIFINYRIKACTLQVYLTDDISSEELEDIEKTIKNIDEEAEIKFISKEDELNKFKDNLKENSNLIDEYNKDIFPASYVVKSKYSKLKDIEQSIISKKGIKTVINSIDKNPYDMFWEIFFV